MVKYSFPIQILLTYSWSSWELSPKELLNFKILDLSFLLWILTIHRITEKRRGETLFLTTISTRSQTSGQVTLSWRRSYHIKTSPLVCRADQWTVLNILGISVMKEYLKLWIRVINRYIYNYQTGIQQDWLSWWISIWLNVNWILSVDCKFVVINFSERPLIRNSLPSAKNLLDMWVTEYL